MLKIKWRKSPETLVARFAQLVPEDPRVDRRKMFGYPCAFVGGNMFMGLYQENLLLRLPESARAELLKLKGAAPFEPMPGRVMREYVLVPPALRDDDAGMRAWVERSLAFAGSLPAKTRAKAKAAGRKK